MSWAINGVALSKVHVISTAVDTPWKTTNAAIHNKKSVFHNEGQDDKTLTLAMHLTGSNRFVLESTLRAQLEASHTILLQAGTNEYVYEDKTECWLIPTSFAVTDKDQILKCTLTGTVDKQTVHSCDTTIHWTADNPIELYTDTRFGAQSVCCDANSNTITCDLSDEPIDLSQRTYLSFWHKVEPGSFSAYALQAHSSGGYCQWDIIPPENNEWTYHQCLLSSPTTIVGSIDLSEITTIKLIYVFA